MSKRSRSDESDVTTPTELNGTSKKENAPPNKKIKHTNVVRSPVLTRSVKKKRRSEKENGSINHKGRNQTQTKDDYTKRANQPKLVTKPTVKRSVGNGTYQFSEITFWKNGTGSTSRSSKSNRNGLSSVAKVLESTDAKVLDPPGLPLTPGLKQKRKDPIAGLLKEQQKTSVVLPPVEKRTSETEQADILEEDSDNCMILNEQMPLTRSRVPSAISLVVVISILFILPFVAISAYRSQIDFQLIKQSLDLEIRRKEAEMDALKKDHKLNLDTVRGDLKNSEEERLSCKRRMEVITFENKELAANASILQKRLDSMIGTEDTMQGSLSKAWKQIDDLRKENHELSALLNTANTNFTREENLRKTIDKEHAICSERLVELEFTSVELGDKIQEDAAKAQKLQEERDLIEFKLHEQQDLVGLLQHQLDEENGHTWYYELQMRYLEGIGEELEGAVSDLKFENGELKKEMQRLTMQILRQNNEAVAALNAVAKSATHRKAEQFAIVDQAANRRVENVKAEAANALNSVLSTVIKKDKG